MTSSCNWTLQTHDLDRLLQGQYSGHSQSEYRIWVVTAEDFRLSHWVSSNVNPASRWWYNALQAVLPTFWRSLLSPSSGQSDYPLATADTYSKIPKSEETALSSTVHWKVKPWKGMVSFAGGGWKRGLFRTEKPARKVQARRWGWGRENREKNGEKLKE